MYDHLYLVRAILHKVLLTTLMEQQTVTNPAVIHGLCAMTNIKPAMHCLLRLAPQWWMDKIYNSMSWSGAHSGLPYFYTIHTY